MIFRICKIHTRTQAMINYLCKIKTITLTEIYRQIATNTEKKTTVRLYPISEFRFLSKIYTFSCDVYNQSVLSSGGKR